MRMILIFTLIVATCLSGPVEAFSQSRKRIYLTEEEASKAMVLQEFTCAGLNGNKCPQGLAKLIYSNRQDPTNSGLCSGFLVGPNTLVTNHHCVSTPEECRATRVVIYNGHGYENARCKRIIKAHVDYRSENRRTIDFAILELTHVIESARPFELSVRSVFPGEMLTPWVIDHFSAVKSRITQLPCVLDRIRAGLELSNCAVISGNSGSPVVDGNSRVVGTLWAADTDETITEETPLEERRNTTATTYVTELKHFRSYLQN